MKLTATQFRKNLYRYLDTVVQTGVPLEIVRKGKIVRIVTGTTASKLSNLKAHTVGGAETDDFITTSWMDAWHRENNLK